MSAQHTLKGLFALPAAVLALGLAASPALASDDEDGRAAAQADVSLNEAAAIAEGEVPGKTVEAELDDEDGRLVYEIEVAAEDGVTEIHVDAHDGSIVGREPEEGDDDEDDDRDAASRDDASATGAAGTTAPGLGA